MAEIPGTNGEITKSFHERLAAILIKLQATVDDFMGREIFNANTMPPEQVEAFIDRVQFHVAVEADSDEIVEGMPFIFTGPGAVCGFDEKGNIGWRPMTSRETFIGTLHSCGVLLAPSRQCILDHLASDNPNAPIVVTDKSMSAALVLEGGRLYSGLQPDGSYYAEKDISHLMVCIPLVYKMPFNAVDMSILTASTESA